MHAATVDMLVKKARFEPPIALAIAEAMDMTIAHSDLVTVSILDARLAEVRAEIAGVRAELKMDIADLKTELKVNIRDIKADLVRWVLLAMLGSAALSSGATAVVKALG